MKTNVFQLPILIPLIKILDVYLILKQELSPDEFCIFLFVEKKSKDKCKFNFNPIEQYFNKFEELRVKLHFYITKFLLNIYIYINIIII